MGKLKAPPFCATFTRVRVIPGVTKRRAKWRFSLPDFYYCNNNKKKLWDIKGPEEKTEAYGKFQLNRDLKIGYQWRSLFKPKWNSAFTRRFVDKEPRSSKCEWGRAYHSNPESDCHSNSAVGLHQAPLPQAAGFLRGASGGHNNGEESGFFPGGSADCWLGVLQSMTEWSNLPLQSPQDIHRSPVRTEAGSKAAPRPLCSGQPAITLLSLLPQAGELQRCTTAMLLRGSRSPFLPPYVKAPRASLHWPVALRLQRKISKLQRFGEVMGESVFDCFYFRGRYGCSEMLTLDRGSSVLVWSQVLEEGERQKQL